jgi:hypothetical protein
MDIAEPLSVAAATRHLQPRRRGALEGDGAPGPDPGGAGTDEGQDGILTDGGASGLQTADGLGGLGLGGVSRRRNPGIRSFAITKAARSSAAALPSNVLPDFPASAASPLQASPKSLPSALKRNF